MRLLLDTHALVWHYEDRPLISDAVSEALDNPSNQIFISTASVWEMAIKVSLGKLNLSRSVSEVIRAYAASGSTILPITQDHALATENLPWHHRDPFDRILIAQAIYENLTLVSRDAKMADYGLNIMW